MSTQRIGSILLPRKQCSAATEIHLPALAAACRPLTRQARNALAIWGRFYGRFLRTGGLQESVNVTARQSVTSPARCGALTRA